MMTDFKKQINQMQGYSMMKLLKKKKMTASKMTEKTGMKIDLNPRSYFRYFNIYNFSINLKMIQ